jgi:manganese transport protein
VLITALDVFLILLLQRLGFRWIEAFIITLLGVIAASFLAQILLARPEWSGVFAGFLPTTEIVTDPGMLYLALGIIGATVMPHNLYLHSGIVQTRAYGASLPEKREAIRFATIDSTLALCFALAINASILILAAAAFNATGNTQVEELDAAHTLLGPLLGASVAPTLFGIALLACGLNSTVTATMAGQIVMEGFLNFRMPAWARRLITRLVAIVPAVAVTVAYGDSGTAKLLIFSQVILGLQLPFAVIPLVLFTASRRKLGSLVAPRWLTAAAGVVAAVIIVLNVKLVIDFVLGL